MVGHLHGWAAWCELSGAQCGSPTGVMNGCFERIIQGRGGRGDAVHSVKLVCPCWGLEGLGMEDGYLF